MGNILILAFLAGITVFPCWLFKKRFEQVFGFALMASVLIIYLCGFFGYMLEGVYALLGWAILSSIMVVWMSRKELKQLFALLITPATIILGVCYVLMYFMFQERLLYEWDEIAFWGPFAKETYRLGEFYNSANSVVDVHLTYPPGSTIFEYIFVILLNHFYEPHLLLSIHVLCLAMLLPCFSKLKLSEAHIWAPLGLLAFLLPGILFPSYLGNIYPDALMGLCFAYAMYQVYIIERSDLFGYVQLAVTTAFLLLIKDTGLAFALVVLVAVAIKVCFCGGKYWQNPNIKTKKKALTICGLTLAVGLPMVIYGLWSYRVSGLGSQFDKGNVFSLQEVFTFIGGDGPKYQYDILSSFMNRLFTSPSSDAPIALSYMLWMVIPFGIMLGLITWRYRKGERKGPHWVNACMFAVGILYALAMLALYLFRFGEYSGGKLASYNRYMNTYMLSYLAFMFMSAVEMFTGGDRKQPYKRLVSILPGVVSLGLVLAFLLPTTFRDRVFFKEDLADNSLMTVRRNLQSDARYLKKLVDTKEDKVFILIQNSRGFEYFSLRYEMLPLATNGNFEWSIGRPYPDKDGVADTWTMAMTADEFANKLVVEGYDYVYLQKSDEQFVEQFGHMFNSRESIGNRHLYKVVDDDGVTRLIKVEPVE